MQSIALIACAWIGAGGSIADGRLSMLESLEKQALAGDLQAQRRIAECYLTGCEGTPAAPALACAWRIVVGASGHAGLTQSDFVNRQRACDGLGPEDRTSAATAAKWLFFRIYGKELVLPMDFFGGPKRAK